MINANREAAKKIHGYDDGFVSSSRESSAGCLFRFYYLDFSL